MFNVMQCASSTTRGKSVNWDAVAAKHFPTAGSSDQRQRSLIWVSWSLGNIAFPVYIRSKSGLTMDFPWLTLMGEETFISFHYKKNLKNAIICPIVIWLLSVVMGLIMDLCLLSRKKGINCSHLLKKISSVLLHFDSYIYFISLDIYSWKLTFWIQLLC